MREEKFSDSNTREESEVEPRVVSVEVAQRLLGDVTYRQVGLMLKRGDLRGCKLGRRRLIELASIDEYIDARLAEARKLRKSRKAAAA
ncbi:helix-turn-helix domain-containing protein [Micromonospora sp. CB01531]|uniref:helix-turn-helix domain-containing protein n=1 Tax=Micromonospora sp. CB01531 TaxID=1718947 RepID=UPI00093CC051|nr:helix-turn-helix domain-containing protein [Micromonospora sp. CB01531]OKI47259.1 hypothetical protein A6A27_10445 [Micromonospora sp. CB01531]